MEVIFVAMSNVVKEDAFLNAPDLMTVTDVGSVNELNSDAFSNAPVPIDSKSSLKNTIEDNLFASLNAKSAIDVTGKPFFSAGIVSCVWKLSKLTIAHSVAEHEYSTPSSVP